MGRVTDLKARLMSRGDVGWQNKSDSWSNGSINEKLLYLNERSSLYEEALSIFNTVLPGVGLSNVQELVFCQSWEEKSYLEIAASSDYDADYLKDVGYRLWQQLSKELGEPVNKHNFRSVFRRQYQRMQQGQDVIYQPTVLKEALEMEPLPSNLNFPLTAICDWGQAAEVTLFEGRSTELDKLESWILEEHCRLVGLFGMVGVGKTAMTVKLAERLQGNFNYLIWRSLRNPLSFDEFVADLVQALSDQLEVTLPESPDGKVTVLIEYLRRCRCLLIIDGWEAILQEGTHQLAGAYRDGFEHYGQLLRRIGDSRHQSCLMITSREKPIGWSFMEGESLRVRSWQLGGLSITAAAAVLLRLGLSATDEHLETLTNLFAGNPLLLKAVSRTILDLFDGSLPTFLEQNVIIYGDVRHILDQQFRRLSVVEKQVMSYLATGQTWASLSDLQEEISPPLSQEQLLEALESLHRRSLIVREAACFSQLELIREYASLYLPLQST